MYSSALPRPHAHANHDCRFFNEQEILHISERDGILYIFATTLYQISDLSILSLPNRSEVNLQELRLMFLIHCKLVEMFMSLVNGIIAKVEQLAYELSRLAPQGVMVHGVGDELLCALDLGSSVA